MEGKNMKKMRKVLTALVCGAMALTLTACGGSSTSDSVVIMSENDLMSLDSRMATDGTSFNVISAFTDGLYGYAEDGTLALALADDVKVSDDQLTYTFTLKDVKWSNGDAVTANDFVYAWRTVISKNSEYAFLLGSQGANIKNAQSVMDNGGDVTTIGVTAKDDKTLVVELDAKCGFLDKLLAFPTFFPINEKFAEEQGDQYANSTSALLSCGAFKLDTWEVGTKVSLSKNADYWDADTVKINNLTINLAQDQSAAALQYDNGELDYCVISSSLVDKYKEESFYSNINNGFLWYLFVNFEDETLANENIRKGLSAAINREDLCENVLKDGSSPATGFVPAELCKTEDGTDFAEKNGDLLAKNEINYDTAKAQEYINAGLKELGKSSVDITMVYGTDEGVDDAATYLEQAFSKLDGVNFKLVPTQKQSRINEYQEKGDFQLSLTRWGPDYADATTYLNNMEKSQWGGNNGGNNYGHYYNAKYDELMSKARAASEASERESLLLQANEILMEDVAIIPIFSQGQAILSNPSLKGLVHNAAGTPYIYKYLTK